MRAPVNDEGKTLGVVRNLEKFSWAEVDCFQRPIAYVCDRFAPAGALRYLFLSSIHQMWLADATASPLDAFIALCGNHLAPVLGIKFDVLHLAESQTPSTQISAALEAGSEIVLPVNLRASPYSSAYKERDLAHYLNVAGSDCAEFFLINDNLHLSEAGTAYGITRIGAQDIDVLAETYPSTPGSWMISPSGRACLLRLSRPIGPRRPHEPRQVLVEFLDELRWVETRQVQHPYLDEVYGATLTKNRKNPTRFQREQVVRGYLASGNFADLHLDIVIQALNAAECGDLALTGAVSRYRQDSALRRFDKAARYMLGELDETAANHAAVMSRRSSLEITRQCAAAIAHALSR